MHRDHQLVRYDINYLYFFGGSFKGVYKGYNKGSIVGFYGIGYDIKIMEAAQTPPSVTTTQLRQSQSFSRLIVQSLGV